MSVVLQKLVKREISRSWLSTQSYYAKYKLYLFRYSRWFITVELQSLIKPLKNKHPFIKLQMTMFLFHFFRGLKLVWMKFYTFVSFSVVPPLLRPLPVLWAVSPISPAHCTIRFNIRVFQSDLFVHPHIQSLTRLVPPHLDIIFILPFIGKKYTCCLILPSHMRLAVLWAYVWMHLPMRYH